MTSPESTKPNPTHTRVISTGGEAVVERPPYFARSATKALTLISLTLTAAAQSKSAYDVSTVRTNKTASGHHHMWEENYTFRTENACMKPLLQDAFGLQPSQIVNLPPWAEHACFDINAKMLDPDPAAVKKLTNAERRALKQDLYADRFGLKFHFETRTLPTFELVLAKSGPKFPAAKPNEKTDLTINNTSLFVANLPLTRLADSLSAALDRPIVDKTGLTGTFDYKLRWSPDDANPDKNPDAPPVLATALEEQLGLRLQTGKDPVQVLIIDQLLPPTEN